MLSLLMWGRVAGSSLESVTSLMSYKQNLSNDDKQQHLAYMCHADHEPCHHGFVPEPNCILCFCVSVP